MKKLVLCTCLGLMMILSFKAGFADETVAKATTTEETKTEAYISGLYNQIDFGKGKRLSYDVFNKACHGYLNLRNAGRLNSEKNIITVCDFNLSSAENRMWIIDLHTKKVLFNTYAAHGQGSGDEYAEHFSNRDDSHQTSLGFYVTGETYNGEHGTSLRLDGMDAGFNDAASQRGIVVHGAQYVCDRYVSSNNRIGRSWGCPAVPQALSLPIINTIKDGTCLFIFHKDAQYEHTAYWMNRKIDRLPESGTATDMFAQSSTDHSGKFISYQYVGADGKIDSVKKVRITQ